MNDSINLWKPYGLTGNPFFQEELAPVSQGAHPISLFVGRIKERQLLFRQLGGGAGESARVIVEGAPGVGKTSFVNRIKAELSADAVLTHDTPVRIEGHTTARGFTAEVLKILLRIRSANRLDGHEAFWQTIARIVEGQDILSGGIAGISIASSRIPSEVTSVSLYEELAQALQYLTHQSGRRILLHINNLENLDRAGAAAAALLIRDLRDYFLLPGADWIFVGTSGVEQHVFGVYPQVAGIFPAAIVLDPLQSDDIKSLLQRRYEHLHNQESTRVIPPVETDTAAALYAEYHGDLRNFLRLLNDAATLALGLTGIVPLDEKEIYAVMAPRRSTALLRRLGETDFSHLVALAQSVLASHELRQSGFRVVDATRILELSQGSVSKIVERFIHHGIITVGRTEGRSAFYHLTGDVCVAMKAAGMGKS